MKHPGKQKGIGIIEVLITTLVISLGLLAVASLQGNLMSSAASNKTSSEAMQLANQKMEQLRDQITTTGYNTICPTTYTGYPNCSYLETATIAGTNENFFRYWTVSVLSNPVRKQISVNVAWPYSTAPTAAPSPDDDHLVRVQSIIAFDNATFSNMVADAGSTTTSGMASPTTNAGSSTVISDSVKVAITGGTAGHVVSTTPNTNGQYVLATSATNGKIVYKCSGETTATTNPFIPYEDADKDGIVDLYTRRVKNQSAFGGFYEAIELAQSNYDIGTNGLGAGVTTCTRQVRYNGGVIIPIKGRIYQQTDVSLTSILSLLGFDASESGVFCKFSSTGLSTTTSVPYYCYVGGNCVNGPEGTIQQGSSGVAAAIVANVTATGSCSPDASSPVTTGCTIVTQCPKVPTGTFTATSPSIYPDNVYASVGPGGWRGNVGVIGLADKQASNTLTTCFATSATAREYYSLRTATNSIQSNEGINKPYLCHDFLVVNPPNGSSTTPNCGDVGALNLAPNPITRSFSGTAANTFDPAVDISHCHVITGTVLSGVTAVGATTSNGGFDCTMTDSTHYSCTGTSKATSVTLASTAGTSASCIATLNNTTLNPTCDLIAGGTGAGHILSGSITAGTASFNGNPSYDPLVMNTGGFSGATCSVTKSGSSYSYNCPSVAQGAVVTFNAVTSGYAISPATAIGGSVDATVNIVVNTAATSHNLTASAGTGGSVANSPTSTTSCGTNCLTYASTVTSVAVTATPSSGYTFGSWTGCDSASANVCTMSMTSDKTVSASFTASCSGTPAAPSPAWPGSGTNPRTLSWNAVSCATGYRIYTCTFTSSSAPSTCTITTTGTPTAQTTTSYTPSALTNDKSVICIAVKSTDGTNDSAASANKCMTRSASSAIDYN